jgi:hypothetical protein
MFEDETDRASQDPELQDLEVTEKVLANAESRQTFWLRLPLVLTLMVATALISSAIFFRTRNFEVPEFEANFLPRWSNDNLGVMYISHA